jgi:peptidoglycan/xylan/chitin deacetylase (PgdA/CDA1 family)
MHTSIRGTFRRLGLTRRRAGGLRSGAERAFLAARGGRVPARPRILCYHSVGTPAWGVNDVAPHRFRRQLEGALSSGHAFVPANQIASGGGLPGQLAITFDDGLASVAMNAAPVLAELHIPWTLFVVSDWADGKSQFPSEFFLGWREIERLAGMGVEVASHSVTHDNFSRMTPDRIASELSDSRRVLNARLGIDTRSFAIPNGRRRDWPAAAVSAAGAAGYDTIYAACEDRRAPGTVGRTMITSWDGDRLFGAALAGAYDAWEEWIP